MKTSPIITRREALKISLATAGALTLPHFSFGQAHAGSSQKLRLAFVGTGMQGTRNLQRLANNKQVEVAALCDADMAQMDKLIEKRELDAGIPQFQDFRELLEAMSAEIDAVVISTPDHNHYQLSSLALEQGKHVYCEKPLCRTIGEVRALASEARNHPELVTQCGNQGHSSDNFARFKDLYDAGLMGEVTEVYGWSGNLSSHWFGSRPNSFPPKVTPAPETMNWPIWLGPAEDRPYYDGYHPRTWRPWFDFGCGLIGDVAVHTLDAAIYAMGLGVPYKVEVSGDAFSAEYMPKNAVTSFYFKAPQQSKDVVMHWYMNNKSVPRPPQLEENRKMPIGGLYMVGEKLTVLGDGIRPGPMIIPDSKRREVGRVPETAPRFGDHYESWVQRCLGEDVPLSSSFDQAAPLMESMLLGVLAQRGGQGFKWFSERMEPSVEMPRDWIVPT